MIYWLVKYKYLDKVGWAIVLSSSPDQIDLQYLLGIPAHSEGPYPEIIDKVQLFKNEYKPNISIMTKESLKVLQEKAEKLKIPGAKTLKEADLKAAVTEAEKTASQPKSEAKNAKKKAEKKAKGPGVIDTIVTILKDAKEPLSKGEISKKLAKKFPERDEVKLSRTVGAQLSGKKEKRIEKGRDIKLVAKKDEGVQKFSIK